jgi:hypothetical protein
MDASVMVSTKTVSVVAKGIFESFLELRLRLLNLFPCKLAFRSP